MEAKFFLDHISGDDADFFTLPYYVSAFTSATRSITFAMQACLSDLDGFRDWYEIQRRKLREDPLIRFFHNYRTISQHIGDSLVTRGSSGARPGDKFKYWFGTTSDVKWVPEDDVETACTIYFKHLLGLVFQCYIDFGPYVDAHQRYTAEFFAGIGKTVEDAEEELGWPRGYGDIGDPDFLPHRWRLMRESVTGCRINHLFDHYLGKVTPYPADPPRRHTKNKR